MTARDDYPITAAMAETSSSPEFARVLHEIDQLRDEVELLRDEAKYGDER